MYVVHIKYFAGLFLLCVVAACHTPKTVENPQAVVNSEIQLRPDIGRIIKQNNDSSGALSWRVVWSQKSCDSVILKSKSGKPLPKQTEYNKDSANFTCNEIADTNGEYKYDIEFGGKIFWLFVSAHRAYTLSSKDCYAMSVDYKHSEWDSMEIVFWKKLDQTSGILTCYIARSKDDFPYFDSSKVDSFTYNLKKFCSQEEADENKKFWQSVITENVAVKINPNPFKEGFELTLDCQNICHMLMGTEQLLSLYDDQGNLLLSQTIERNKAYNFSFPEIKSGSIIHYRITWLEFVLGGQVMKS